MDMWQAFQNSTRKAGHAPQAALLFDKFHVLRQLHEALDQVRKSEYARLSGKDRQFIKGQKYPLLSRREQPPPRGPRGRKEVGLGHTRLTTASPLKGAYGQVWGYHGGRRGRRVFSHWRAALAR